MPIFSVRAKAGFHPMFSSGIPGGSTNSTRGIASRELDETPFLQIAEYVGSIPNSSAQDAVKELYGRPMKLRVFLDICYMSKAPPPKSVKLKFIQNNKEVLPATDVRSVFAERFSETSFLLPNGESAELEFDPKKLDSSTLTILIDTPNGQHAETTFDLQSLR